jgi:ribonuclease VapC
MAILLQEDDAGKFADAIELDERPAISAATLVEVGAVALGRGGVALLGKLQSIIADAGLEVVPLSLTHAELALAAYRRFGRKIGTPSCLNMGDCFSYALAKGLDAPLLYKGDDFARTDIRSAL